MVLICKTLNPPSLVKTDLCIDSGEEDFTEDRQTTGNKKSKHATERPQNKTKL